MMCSLSCALCSYYIVCDSKDDMGDIVSWLLTMEDVTEKLMSTWGKQMQHLHDLVEFCLSVVWQCPVYLWIFV